MGRHEPPDDSGSAAEIADSRAAFDLGSHYADNGDWARAEQQYRRAVELGYRAACYPLGRALHEQQKLEAAEQVYREAVAAGDTAATIALGVLLSERGDPDELAEAEALFRQALTAGAEDVLLNYANLLAQWPGRQDEAEQAYRRCLEEGITEAHNNLGMMLHEMGRDVEAEAEFRRGIAAGDAWAWYGLGMLRRDQDRRAEAEAAFRSALAGGKAEARADLIDLYVEAGGVEEAEREYLEAIAAGDIERRVDLGVLYQSLGRYGEAEQQYRDAIRAGVGRAHISLGNLLDEALDRPREAEEEYRLAVAAGVDVGSAAYNLAICLDRQGREQEALENYHTAASLGYKPARWILADRARRADPAQQHGEVWVGLVDLKPQPGNDVFEGAAGAFTHTCALARDDAEYRRAVEDAFGAMRLEVKAIGDVEPFRSRALRLEPDADMFETAAGVSDNAPVVPGPFYLYQSEDE